MKTTYYPVGHLHDFSKLSILTWNDMREFIDSLKEDTALFFDDIKMPNYVDRPTATVFMGKNNGQYFLDIVDTDMPIWWIDSIRRSRTLSRSWRISGTPVIAATVTVTTITAVTTSSICIASSTVTIRSSFAVSTASSTPVRSAHISCLLWR